MPILSRRLARFVVAGVLLPLGTLTHVGLAGAEGVDEEAAERAAAEIQAARDEANAAALAVAEAETELGALEDRASELTAELTALQGEVATLRRQVEQVAINRFTSSGSSPIPLLTSYSEPNDRLQAELLASLVTEASADSMDCYDLKSTELQDKQAEVDANQARLEQRRAAFEQAQRDAERLVVHLQEVEAQRLQDEQVRIALERQQAEERRQREAREAAERAEQERQAAAAAATTLAPAAPSDLPAAPAPAGIDPPSTTTRPTTPPTTTPSRNGSGSNGGGGGNSGGGNNGGGGSQPAPTTPPTTRPPTRPTTPPTTTPPTTTPPTSGGGGGGGGGGGIVCPVQGPRAYVDTWGAARSGGRSHQGVDLISPAGTPLVAVESGSVQFKQTRLGGNSVWLNGASGTRYFYAHLSRFEGSSRSVSRGEVIGYVGATGNANGTNHLHFEVHPGGGAAVNPYPIVRAAGC